VPDDEENPEQVIPEGEEQADQQGQEEHAPGGGHVITMSKWRRMESKSKLSSKAQQ
jgi:hypothetical protein